MRQCDQIWQNLTTLAQSQKSKESSCEYIKVVLGKIMKQLAKFCNIFVQIFNVGNGQILTKHSSHLVSLSALMSLNTMALVT